jgi:hypothetical protein
VHYSYYQELHNTYQTIKGNGKFEVRHVLKGSSPLVSHIADDFVEINFINSNYFFYDYWIGSKTYPTYKEFLSINGKVYSDVFAKYLGLNFSDDTLNKNFIYINKNYGLIYNRNTNPFIEFYLIK